MANDGQTAAYHGDFSLPKGANFHSTSSPAPSHRTPWQSPSKSSFHATRIHPDQDEQVAPRSEDLSPPGSRRSAVSGATPGSSNDGDKWWKIHYFQGMKNDIRRRAPYYWSDWKDAWDYRVVPATVYMYFAKYDPHNAQFLLLLYSPSFLYEVLLSAFQFASLWPFAGRIGFSFVSWGSGALTAGPCGLPS